jgi:hypothetical protein
VQSKTKRIQSSKKTKKTLPFEAKVPKIQRIVEGIELKNPLLQTGKLKERRENMKRRAAAVTLSVTLASDRKNMGASQSVERRKKEVWQVGGKCSKSVADWRAKPRKKWPDCHA